MTNGKVNILCAIFRVVFVLGGITSVFPAPIAESRTDLGQACVKKRFPVQPAGIDLSAKLNPVVQKLADEDKFSGVVLVAKNGRTIYLRAFGQANKSFGVVNRTDTKFNLGSMGKMFTSIAISQLAEQGKLSFDDRIAKYLPDYPNKEVAERVTVHQLLTHTSGLGDYFDSQFQGALKTKYRQLADYLPLFVEKPLLFVPGARFSYSNAGFIVLGLIIERISGKSYFDYVREKLYLPAKMTNTDNFDVDMDVPNLAVGYTNIGYDGKTLSAPRRSNIFLHSTRGVSAGGGYSTAEDLLNFSDALRENRLLGPKFRETAMTGKVNTYRSPGEQYAYGFQVWQSNGVEIVGHGGGFPGIHSRLDMFPSLGYTSIVLSNYDPPSAKAVADEIRRLITMNVPAAGGK